jgi:hypothetical protein
MSSRRTLHVGGYNLSDEEAAELARLQYGTYEPVVFMGSSETETASTVGEDVRQLFKGYQFGSLEETHDDKVLTLEGDNFSLDAYTTKEDFSLDSLASM